MPFIKKSDVIPLLQMTLIMLPISVLLYFVLIQTSQEFAPILTQQVWNVVAFGILGCVAIWLNAKYVRFTFAAALLAIVSYILLWVVGGVKTDIFESYSLTVSYKVMATFGLVGFGVGYAISRFRWGATILGLLSVILGIQFAIKSPLWDQWQNYNNPTWKALCLFAPFVLLALYLLLTSNNLYFLQKKSDFKSFWKKQLLFVVILLSLVALAFPLLHYPMLNLVEKLESQKQSNENSMLKNASNPDQGTAAKSEDGKPRGKTLNDLLKVGGKNNKGKQLLFIAYMDNFFEDNETPNPLYLAMYYYGKFNPKDETFLVDSIPPRNDLFIPKLDQLALYQTQRDSSKIADQKEHQFVKEVNITVFKKNLDITTFTAPSVAYSVQPITVEPTYRSEFYSAYQAISLVSQLNSAYFIYNDDRAIVRDFQEQRNEILRTADFSSIQDTAFYNFYTAYPSGNNFDSIAQLSQEITKTATTNLDKVLAIRDFFLARNELGKRIFKYSDNPGIPELPSASRLNYFLFHQKEGYCAYYAGATLYMLRALGIPSRIVGGFLTENRSKGKNAGWYWYYEDQAHAWVQVYFPGFGWIDFDTTIDNEDAREGEQSDGTPPTIPQQPSMAIQAKVEAIDSAGNTVTLSFDELNFDNQSTKLSTVVNKEFDTKNALIKNDTALLNVADLKLGDSIVALSFDKSLSERFTDASAMVQSKALLPLNELQLHPEKPALDDKAAIATASKELSAVMKNVLKVLSIILTVVLILGIIFFPYLQFLYLKTRIKNAKDDIDRLNRQHALLLWLMKRDNLFSAKNTLQENVSLFDKKNNTRFVSFAKTYNNAKFGKSNVDLSAAKEDFEMQLTQYFKQYNFKKKLKYFSLF